MNLSLAPRPHRCIVESFQAINMNAMYTELESSEMSGTVLIQQIQQRHTTSLRQRSLYKQILIGLMLVSVALIATLGLWRRVVHRASIPRLATPVADDLLSDDDAFYEEDAHASHGSARQLKGCWMCCGGDKKRKVVPSRKKVSSRVKNSAIRSWIRSIEPPPFPTLKKKKQMQIQSVGRLPRLQNFKYKDKRPPAINTDLSGFDKSQSCHWKTLV